MAKIEPQQLAEYMRLHTRRCTLTAITAKVVKWRFNRRYLELGASVAADMERTFSTNLGAQGHRQALQWRHYQRSREAVAAARRTLFYTFIWGAGKNTPKQERMSRSTCVRKQFVIYNWKSIFKSTINAEKLTHVFQCTPRHVSSRTATTFQSFR
jgi:hypothetical protein